MARLLRGAHMSAVRKAMTEESPPLVGAAAANLRARAEGAVALVMSRAELRVLGAALALGAADLEADEAEAIRKGGRRVFEHLHALLSELP